MTAAHPRVHRLPRHHSRLQELEAQTPQRVSTEEFSHSRLQRLGLTGVMHTVIKGNILVEYLKILAANPTDPNPILANKGLLASAAVYVPTLAHMSELGRDTAVVRRAKYIKPTVGTRYARISNVTRLEAQASAIAIEDMQAHDEAVVQADVFGHSKGGIVTSDLVDEKPHLVRSADSVAGAGVGGGNLLRVVTHAPGLLVRELALKQGLLLEELGRDVAGETADQIMDDVLAIPLQALACLTRDARPGFRRGSANGVAIGMTAFGNDSLFSDRRMMAANADYIPAHRQWTIPGALHVHPQLFPEINAGEQIERFNVLNSTVLLQ